MIRHARKGIRHNHTSGRVIDNLEIVIGKEISPSRETTREMFGYREGLEVLMIRENDDRRLGGEQPGTPVFERIANDEQLLFASRIVAFRGFKLARKETDR